MSTINDLAKNLVQKSIEEAKSRLAEGPETTREPAPAAPVTAPAAASVAGAEPRLRGASLAKYVELLKQGVPAEEAKKQALSGAA